MTFAPPAPVRAGGAWQRRTAMLREWIKWCVGLAEKGEILATATRLKMHRFHVAGCCMKLWEWADQNTDDGCNARSVTFFALNAIAECPGLCESLAEAGWLIQHEWGVEFVRGDRHNGKTAKQRALSRERMLRYRNAKETRTQRKSNGSCVTEKEKENIPPYPPSGGGVSPAAQEDHDLRTWAVNWLTVDFPQHLRPAQIRNLMDLARIVGRDEAKAAVVEASRRAGVGNPIAWALARATAKSAEAAGNDDGEEEERLTETVVFD